MKIKKRKARGRKPNPIPVLDSALDGKEVPKINRVTIPNNILVKAEGLVYGDRNKVYRHPDENFQNIAALYNAYFVAISRRNGTLQIVPEAPCLTGAPNVTLQINAIDVAYLNILQKIARAATAQDHLDTVVDIAGYAACVERILEKK